MMESGDEGSCIVKDLPQRSAVLPLVERVTHPASSSR
jgi:hypothetical protein